MQVLPNLISKKEILPSNWATVLGEKHDYSPEMIRQMIRGVKTGTKYHEVVEDFLNMVEAHKAKMAEITERAKRI